MKKRSFFYSIVFLLAGCADSPAPDSAKTAGLQQLGQTFGLHLTIDAQSLNASPWDIRYTPIQSEQDPALLDYLPLFEQEFAKLPDAILTLSGLRTVAFVRGLSIGDQPRAAVPDYEKEVLYYDVDAPGEAYIRHVLHHEFYHMLEQQLYGDAYYKDPQWQKLNPPDFKYGRGGAYARDKSVSVFSHPHPGFVNLYSMSGLEEDKAEIWSILWSQGSWEATRALVAGDSALQDKILLLTTQIQCRTPAASIDWPEYVREYAATRDACGAIDQLTLDQPSHPLP